MLKTLILAYFIIAFFTFNSKAQDFWEEVILPDSIQNIYSIDFNSNDEVFICTNIGIFNSTDNGKTWSNIAGFIAGTVVISSGDEIYIGIDAQNRILHSNSNGLNWDTIQTPFVLGGFIQLIYDSILFAYDWGWISKSNDGGYTWTEVLSTSNVEIFNDIIEKDSFLFAGSTNFLSSTGGGVYRSADDGDTWEHISMAGHGVSSFALDIDVNLLAGVRFNYSYIDYGVFRSYDNGILWDNLLPGHLVTSLAVDEFGGIYAGCDSDFGPEGVKYSYNNGLSWETLNAGFHDDAYITSLAISPANYIFASTYSPNYLYRSINPIVSISEKSREQLVIKVFPNPFQDRINLHINNTLNCNNEKLTLKIFNSSSQIIYSCENSVNNEFSINLEKLPSGLYYCLIITGTTEHNTKLIKK